MKKILPGALISAGALFLCLGSPVSAAPTGVAPADVVTPPSEVTQVRYVRRHVQRYRGRPYVRYYRRNPGFPAAAALGIFGAVLGAGIAGNRYNDEYYYGGRPAYGYYGRPAYNGYGYGYPGDYGY